MVIYIPYKNKCIHIVHNERAAFEVSVMKERKEYYIVERSKLPEIFVKTVRAKKLLTSGKAKTVGEAAAAVGLSRSAYYKYKDSVAPFYEAGADRIVTFNISLTDEPEGLSSILGLFAETKANILTINQSIPLNGVASVTISARTGDTDELKDLVDQAQTLKGVFKFEVVASE